MGSYAPVVGICWLTFFLVWIATAMRGGQLRRRYSPGCGAVRLLVGVGVLFGVVFGRLTSDVFGQFTQGVAAAGSVLCIAGLLVAIWARVTLGSNWGMPMTLHENPELVTSGPYRYVRHPIYTGMSAMVIATVLVFPPALMWAAVMAVYMVLSAFREEHDMARRFPDSYPAYKQRTKMLVPFVF